MAALLIIAHAPLASALKAVAGHAFPECAEGVGAIDITPSMSTQDIEHAVRAWRATTGEAELLILTDVFGATPCNAAQALADGPAVRLVSGVNVPMLWRTLCYRAESLDSLVARAMAGATQGVMRLASTRPQNQSQKLPVHDQDHVDDQQ